MPLPPVSEKKFTEGFGPGGATTGKLRIIVTGAGGCIASHLSKRLKADGHFVRGVDWKENEYMEPSEFCDEFKNLDLRWPDACAKAVAGRGTGASTWRRTWAGWGSSSRTTRASSSTRR